MKEIPTAEEFIKKYWECDEKFIESIKQQMSKMGGIDFNNISDLMIEFAKLHLEAQRKAIKKKVKIYNDSDIDLVDSIIKYVKVDKISIDDAYPLNNVK